MDGSFELLLPEDLDLKAMGFEVAVFEWDGVLYPKDTLSYRFGRNFILTLQEQSNVWLMRSFFPPHFQKIRWHSIEISGDGMDFFFDSLLGSGNEEKDFTLRDLLTWFTQKTKIWMVVYQYQNDGFQWVKKGSVETVILNLEKSVLTDSNGFLVYS